jgi:zinc protease
MSFYALARGGTMSVPEANDISASLAAEMLSASGLGPYSRPELVRALADKQASFSFWASAFLRGFQGSAARRDLKVLMEMIHLGFTQPRLDSDAVSILLEQRRTRLLQEAENPDAFFSREVTRTVYGNPRLHPLEVADLEKVSMDKAMDFIQLSLNPTDYTLVFTGSLSPEELRPLVETYLASIPPKETSFDEWAYIDYQRPASIQREIRKGKEDRSSVYICWFTPYDYSEEAMAAVSVLEEYLDIRLTEEIRETLGGVYSVSPSVSLSPLPRGELNGSIYFICNPNRARELAAAAVNQVREVAMGRINIDTLIKSREALVMSHEQSVQGNLYIAQSYANSMVIYESPLTRLDNRPRLYQAVTAQDIQRIAARLLSGPQVEIILYPEGW